MPRKSSAQLQREIDEVLAKPTALAPRANNVEVAVAKVEKALERVVAKYKKYERTTPDKPIVNPIPGVPYPGPRHGGLRVIRNQSVQEGMFPRTIRIGVAVGAKIGWPANDRDSSVSVSEREAWHRAYAEQQVIVDKVVADIKKAIEPLVKAHGGFFVKVIGSSYSPMGWVAP